MKTPAGDGAPSNNEAHLPGRVAFPINITVTGSMLTETLHSRWSEPRKLRSRDPGEDLEVLRAFRAITLKGSG
jgi:hypothetical protein